VTSGHHELQPRWHLADLHRAFGRLRPALEEARAATAAARRTHWDTVIAMALLKEASCALAAGEVAEAIRAADEALDLIDGNPYQDLLHGRILATRARCLVEQGKLDDAEEDLVGARAMIEARPAPSHFAGMQRGLAHWWSAMARLRVARGDTRGAIEAQRSAIRHWRWVCELPHAAPAIPRERMAEAIGSYGELLTRADDPDGAEAAFSVSRAIRGSLGLPEELGVPLENVKRKP
jgi:tetratricopeptide (TPR) repeat protein